jgi:hypothetical protein
MADSKIRLSILPEGLPETERAFSQFAENGAAGMNEWNLPIKSFSKFFKNQILPEIKEFDQYIKETQKTISGYEKLQKTKQLSTKEQQIFQKLRMDMKIN